MIYKDSDIIPNFPSVSGIMVKSQENSVIVSCDICSELAKQILSPTPYITLNDSKHDVNVLQVMHLIDNRMLIEYLIEEKG